MHVEDVESTPEPEGDEPLDADEDPSDTLQLKNMRKHIKHEYWEKTFCSAIYYKNLIDLKDQKWNSNIKGIQQ